MKFGTFGRVTDATINSIRWSSSTPLLHDGAPNATAKPGLLAAGTSKSASRILEDVVACGGLVEPQSVGLLGSRRRGALTTASSCLGPFPFVETPTMVSRPDRQRIDLDLC